MAVALVRNLNLVQPMEFNHEHTTRSFIDLFSEKGTFSGAFETVRSFSINVENWQALQNRGWTEGKLAAAGWVAAALAVGAYAVRSILKFSSEKLLQPRILAVAAVVATLVLGLMAQHQIRQVQKDARLAIVVAGLPSQVFDPSIQSPIETLLSKMERVYKASSADDLSDTEEKTAYQSFSSAESKAKLETARVSLLNLKDGMFPPQPEVV